MAGTYDANGNILTGDGATYTYDARGRQSGYVKGSSAASYTYYPTGLRKTKMANMAVTTYVWDDSNMVLEYTGSAASGQLYVYGLTLISMGNSWYYIYNARGDVVKYINAAGAVLKSYDYDAFGEEVAPNSADANPFRYAGQYFDSETGTYYLRARYYNPALGRFTQQDAWGYGDPGDPLSLNLYVYCYGNPVRYYDPSGNIAITTLILIGSLVVGVVAATHTAVVSHKYTGKIDWNNTLLTGFSWFMLAYSMGMSAYGVYLSYCDYKGYTPVTEVSFRNTQKSLQNAANSVKSTTTGHVSGTKQHTEFAKKVNELGNDRLKTEVSYLNGKEVPYGTKGAVRLDVVEYDANNNIVAVYDLKTGSATLTARRIDQIQKHVGMVPVIEIKPE